MQSSALCQMIGEPLDRESKAKTCVTPATGFVTPTFVTPTFVTPTKRPVLVIPERPTKAARPYIKTSRKLVF